MANSVKWFGPGDLTVAMAMDVVLDLETAVAFAVPVGTKLALETDVCLSAAAAAAGVGMSTAAVPARYTHNAPEGNRTFDFRDCFAKFAVDFASYLPIYADS